MTTESRLTGLIFDFSALFVHLHLQPGNGTSSFGYGHPLYVENEEAVLATQGTAHEALGTAEAAMIVSSTMKLTTAFPPGTCPCYLRPFVYCPKTGMRRT